MSGARRRSALSPRALYRSRGLLAALFALLLVLSPGQLRWCTVGFLLLAAATALRIWSRRYIGEHSRQNEWGGSELLVDGPYAKMRHPLYLSNLLAGWALVLFSGPLALHSLLLAFLWLLFCRALGVVEDRFLLQKFVTKWWFWASITPFWGWGSRTVSPLVISPANLAPPPPRSSLNAFWADRWSWLWQLLILLLLASPLRGN